MTDSVNKKQGNIYGRMYEKAGVKSVDKSNVTQEEKKELIFQALAARERSYSPYSGYCVGAAVLTGTHRMYTGCNIENAAYTPTNCAERTAIFKAVSEGERTLTAIAIAGSPKGAVSQYAYPCGVCRQVMREFADPDQMLVLIVKSETEYIEKTLAELLPESFGPENLEK